MYLNLKAGYIKECKLTDCEEIVEKTILRGEHIGRLSYEMEGMDCKKQEDIPFYNKKTRLVLEHCGHIDATYKGVSCYRRL